MIKNIDSLNDNLREDVKKVKAYYGNTDVPNVDIISKENEIIDRMKSVEVPHSDYYRIDVLDNKQPVLTFNIEDTEKMIERSSELSTAGISFRIELPTEESRFGRIEFFNLNKYNVSSISEELYDTLSSARNDSGISFSDIRPVDNLEVYREANNLITQYTTALREISESTDSSRILEIYNSISQPIDYFFSSEAFLDKIYHTSVGQSVSEDLFACRDAFNSLVSQYIEINPLNYNESYNDDNYYNYVEDRNSSLHDELSELQIWTAIDMLEVDADRLEIAPELREYYEEIVKIENEIESYLIENNPDMEEYRFSFDFKTNQAVITDRDDFSVVYATFERNEEREDIFVPNFEHGEDRGMLMLDYQRDLTELYDRVDSYRERFIDDIKQKEEESQRGIVNTSLYEHSVEDILSKIDSKDIDADDARSLAREHLVLREILTELNNPHDFATINTLTIDETEVTNLLYQIATN